MELKEHPFINKTQIESVAKFHDAMDMALSIHYTTNSRLMTAHELFDKAGKLQQRRTKIENFLSILMVDKYEYKVIEPEAVKDYSPCYVTIFGSIKNFNASIQSRKVQFREKLNVWITENSHIGYFKTPEVKDLIKLHNEKVETSRPRTPNKIAKPSIIKNDSSKYIFKPKNEMEESKRTGLSLIERIQMKEKLRNEANALDTPEMRRDNYLTGKLVPIYNILFQTNNLRKGESFKSYPLTQLTATIKDSLDYPMHEDEVHDSLKLLQKSLSNKVEICTSNNLSVVKIHRLDRSKDLPLLK